PSTEYSIVINADNKKPYLQHSNCDHKIEITSALLNDMTQSYVTSGQTYQMTNN
ncbi:13998_t:CDS:2, partial [Racocetra persica]